MKGIIGSLKPERVKKIRVISLCILAAGTFWFLNALNDTYSTTLRYPITFLYDTDKYVALEKLPEEIQLNVSGVGWNLFRNNVGLSEAPVSFKLDRPSEVKKLPGTTLLGTVTDHLTEFEVNFILTDTLFVNIDNKIERSFALTVDSLGIDLDDNYWISSTINYEPDSVTLLGPESILRELSDSISVNIPQEGIDESFSEDIPISISNTQLITRNPPTINVRFDVEEYLNSSRAIPIEMVNFPEDSSAYLSSKNTLVFYQIATTSESSIDDAGFQVVADFLSFNTSDSTLLLTLGKSPVEARNVAIDSTRIRVLFREQP